MIHQALRDDDVLVLLEKGTSHLPDTKTVYEKYHLPGDLIVTIGCYFCYCSYYFSFPLNDIEATDRYPLCA